MQKRKPRLAIEQSCVNVMPKPIFFPLCFLFLLTQIEENKKENVISSFHLLKDLLFIYFIPQFIIHNKRLHSSFYARNQVADDSYRFTLM